MFLHDYLLACEISTVRTLDLMLDIKTHPERIEKNIQQGSKKEMYSIKRQRCSLKD